MSSNSPSVIDQSNVWPDPRSEVINLIGQWHEGNYYRQCNTACHFLLVPRFPDWWNPKPIGFPAVCQPICPSVRLSVLLLDVRPLGFRTSLSCPLRYWLKIWYMNSSWYTCNTDLVRVSSRLTYFDMSYCPLLKKNSKLFSVIFWDITLKYGTWICHNIIQIIFAFLHVWLSFTGVIALC